MNIKRFAMPVIVAASLHGSLFLSSFFSMSGAAYVKPVKKPVSTIREVIIEDPIPPDIEEKVAEVESLPDAQKGETLPELPLTIVENVKTDFPDPLPDDLEVKVTRADLRNIGPIGTPDGRGELAYNISNTRIFATGDLDRAPNARVQRAPEYPLSLKQQGVSGSVVVEFDVNKEGAVARASAVRFTHSEFVEPALRAVRSWRFEPGKRDGRAVPFRMIIPIEFGLSDEN
ncbi:TonB family protein [Oleiharenicola lentus]|uniref:energy transducer TonB n=1 Tax=Oleiharenicola lentus TaxID=2508720 RepID=UPI003F66C271